MCEQDINRDSGLYGELVRPSLRIPSPPLSDAATTARDRAVASRALQAGTRVLAAEPAALALLPALKGAWCDWCVRAAPNLRRCSRCAAYYYCDAKCTSCLSKYVRVLS
ncbi:hypothetical protein AURDEDRAFT_176370 [Auricularia subglabra TFB-10046 SS5]|uniref:MYND-type domain-containing protein n=1 Tax=Auricularia subglabra (strain TFB-10046 / SS5) TaxID=717982 RepID=J0LDD7_AURST|nr:hypothetical protein AURDEDRAFT_176370 [Auricularia subglabra TFB-10046 SS5]